MKELLEPIKYVSDYDLDIQNRTIYFVGEVEPDLVLLTVEHLNMLASPKYFKNYEEPITLLINSPGGADDMTFFLYDAIQACSAPVYTVGTGMVCSAASLILSCGDKRFGTENCWLMTHKGNITLSGDDDAVESQSELNKKVSDRYWKLLERHTKRTALQWYRKSRDEGELWLNAEDMIEWGVIDELIPTRRTFEPLSKRLIKDLLKEGKDDE